MKRVAGIDMFKVLAAFFVVTIHTSPFAELDGPVYKHLSVLMSQMARFAVPFFFIASGYLFTQRLARRPDISRAVYQFCSRLFLIWLAWSLLYLVPYKFTAIFELGYLGPLKEAYWDLSSWVSSWEKLLFVGSKHHLWFFPSLIIAALITGLFSGLKRYGALYLCAAALYVIGVLAGSYSDTPIGLEIGIHTRHGPFFGTFCFVSGVFLARLQRQRGVFSLGSGGLLLSAGLILSTLEVYVLEDLYGSSLMQDYTFATPLFGLGVFLLALSPAVSRQNYRLADYGIYTLGIYLIHPAIVDLMSPLDKLFFNPVWHLVYPVAAFIVSLLAARVFSEWRYMRSIAK